MAETVPDVTVKKSVTLRRSLAEEIEARTGARGFSAFVDAAVERALALIKADEILDDFQRKHGPLPADTLAEGESAWRGE